MEDVHPAGVVMNELGRMTDSFSLPPEKGKHIAEATEDGDDVYHSINWESPKAMIR